MLMKVLDHSLNCGLHVFLQGGRIHVYVVEILKIYIQSQWRVGLMTMNTGKQIAIFSG